MKLHVGGHLAALKIEKLTLQFGQEQKYPFPLMSGPCEPRRRARGSPFTAQPAVLTGLRAPWLHPNSCPKTQLFLGKMNAEGAPKVCYCTVRDTGALIALRIQRVDRLISENDKKCHHFKEIRERIVRVCGKHCCSKHGQQWGKVQQFTWKDEEILRWTMVEKPKHPTEGTWERWKWASPRAPGGDCTSPGWKTIGKEPLCNSSPHFCSHEELQQTAWRRKTCSVLPKAGHCQEQEPGSDWQCGSTSVHTPHSQSGQTSPMPH